MLLGSKRNCEQLMKKEIEEFFEKYHLNLKEGKYNKLKLEQEKLKEGEIVISSVWGKLFIGSKNIPYKYSGLCGIISLVQEEKTGATFLKIFEKKKEKNQIYGKTRTTVYQSVFEVLLCECESYCKLKNNFHRFSFKKIFYGFLFRDVSSADDFYKEIENYFNIHKFPKKRITSEKKKEIKILNKQLTKDINSRKNIFEKSLKKQENKQVFNNNKNIDWSSVVPVWEEIFKNIGIDCNDLEDPETAKYLVEVAINSHKEILKKSSTLIDKNEKITINKKEKSNSNDNSISSPSSKKVYLTKAPKFREDFKLGRENLKKNNSISKNSISEDNETKKNHFNNENNDSLFSPNAPPLSILDQNDQSGSGLSYQSENKLYENIYPNNNPIYPNNGPIYPNINVELVHNNNNPVHLDPINQQFYNPTYNTSGYPQYNNNNGNVNGLGSSGASIYRALFLKKSLMQLYPYMEMPQENYGEYNQSIYYPQEEEQQEEESFPSNPNNQTVPFNPNHQTIPFNANINSQQNQALPYTSTNSSRSQIPSSDLNDSGSKKKRGFKILPKKEVEKLPVLDEDNQELVDSIKERITIDTILESIKFSRKLKLQIQN